MKDPKFCEECKKEGKKSIVRYRGSSKTLMGGCWPFWDEDGQHHHHDPNTTTHAYECSNGHAWTEKEKPTCWCGWPKEKKDDQKVQREPV